LLCTAQNSLEDRWREFFSAIRFLCFIPLIFAPLAPLSQVTPLTHEEGKFRLQESVGFKP
jgi:hypothetical protein